GQPDTTCHAFVGETVVLPCTTTSPGELALSKSMLYWQIESDLVHFFHNGQDSLQRQDKRYHGRTSLFLDQMKHGNFSLKLSNIQLQDAAVYTCIYKQTGDHPNKTQKSEIKLIVSGTTFFFSSERGRHSQISSRSLADAPCLAMLPVSFHLLVTLGFWNL
ncbi:VTCN1 inhibitor, partial [Ceuthmochares aereus]|nr:VTCN1 inhibitor [Ceuthmochares aereus]